MHTGIIYDTMYYSDLSFRGFPVFEFFFAAKRNFEHPVHYGYLVDVDDEGLKMIFKSKGEWAEERAPGTQRETGWGRGGEKKMCREHHPSFL